VAETLFPLAKQKFFDNNGAPLAGGKIFTYQAGTTTKLGTFTDSTGGTPNSNPIICNARGECDIWIPLNTGYKIVVAPPTDTDPPTAAIWSVDNVVNSQLLTLYAGVDTGIANAYILNFVANFTAYADGIILYWIPSHSNTGPSTINVNGLGVVNITKQDGTPLQANNIFANQVSILMFKSGAFLLISSGNIAPTLYGGTSTHIGNAYSLTFSSQFVAYADGVLVYWTPDNTNTGASTLNINGLGAVPIVNQDLSALASSTIFLGQIVTVMYKGGNFLLLSTGNVAIFSTSGSFSPIWFGLTANPAGNMNYQIVGRQVTLEWVGSLGTSNATGLAISNLPLQLRPASSAALSGGGMLPVMVVDAGIVRFGAMRISGSSIDFAMGATPSETGFTAAGTKGLENSWTATYLLN
jgi:hypothetical protein